MTAVGALDDMAACGLVVEAVVEQLEVKRLLLARLEEVVAAETVLATNTSSLSVTAVAAGLARPERVVGLHFFNPAPVMPLVEVVSGDATYPEVASAMVDLAVAWGKTPVRCASTPGFIVNRVARPFYGESPSYTGNSFRRAPRSSAYLRHSPARPGARTGKRCCARAPSRTSAS